MKILRKTLIVFAAVAFAGFGSTVIAKETGTLKLTVTYGGGSPTPEKINVNKDIEYCGQFPLVDESLIVNPTNSGLKDVIVYVYTGRGGSKLPEFEPVSQTLTLANDQCRFEPHILLARAGDKINVTNPDKVGHNANMGFFVNKAVNFLIPPGGEKATDVLEKAEPAPISVECNIHPWMRAYVLVLDHPFAGVSDVDGAIEIKDIPVGELQFRIFQQGIGKIEEVVLNGKKTKTKKNILTLDIKPGMNDLGTMVIPAN